MQRQRFITTLKKYDWEKKEKPKSFIRFNSANKINNYNGGGGGREKKKKEKNPKETAEQVKT